MRKFGRRKFLGATLAAMLPSFSPRPVRAAEEGPPSPAGGTHHGHEHFKRLKSGLLRQAERLFGRDLENASQDVIEVVAKNLLRAAEISSRHIKIEEHISRIWGENGGGTMDHVLKCPICYSNTTDLVQDTALKSLLSEKRFQTIYWIDDSYFMTDSYGNLYPSKGGTVIGPAVAAVWHEDDEYVALRFGDNVVLKAEPAMPM